MELRLSSADQRRGHLAEAGRHEVSYVLQHGQRRARDRLRSVRTVVERDDLVAVAVPEAHRRSNLLEPESPRPRLDRRVEHDTGRARAECLTRGGERELPDFRLAEERL